MRRGIILTAVTGIAYAITGPLGLILLNTSDSIPKGIYTRDFTTVTTTSVVSFCAPESIRTWLRIEKRNRETDGGWGFHCGGATPFVKRVAAIAGQRVVVRADGIHIDNDPTLPGSAPLIRIPIKDSRETRDMPNIIGRTYNLHAGEIWAYSPKWDSLDSRYYGPVHPFQNDLPLATLPWNHPLKPPPAIAALQIKNR